MKGIRVTLRYKDGHDESLDFQGLWAYALWLMNEAPKYKGKVVKVFVELL